MERDDEESCRSFPFLLFLMEVEGRARKGGQRVRLPGEPSQKEGEEGEERSEGLVLTFAEAGGIYGATFSFLFTKT